VYVYQHRGLSVVQEYMGLWRIGPHVYKGRGHSLPRSKLLACFNKDLLRNPVYVHEFIESAYLTFIT